MTCLLLLAGCSSDRDVPAEAGRAGTAVVPAWPRARLSGDTGDQAVSLIEAFGLGGTGLAALRDIVVQRTSSCMSQAGFSYRDPTQVNVVGLQGITIQQLLAQARTRGYGVTAGPAPNSSPAPLADPNMEFVRTLDAGRQEAFWTALTGRSTPGMDEVVMPLHSADIAVQGCLGRGLHAVMDPLPFFSAGVGDQLRAFTASSPKSAAMRTAVRSWSACMKTRGYAFAQPGEAVAAVQQRAARSSAAHWSDLRREETVQAAADAGCYATEIHPVQRRLERAYLTGLAAAEPAYRAGVDRVLSAW